MTGEKRTPRAWQLVQGSRVYLGQKKGGIQTKYTEESVKVVVV